MARYLHDVLEHGGPAGELVPDILAILYHHMPTIQEGGLRQFLMEAVSILAHHHREAVISSLLSKCLPMDSDIAEQWRSLGGDPLLATQILHVPIEKIKTPTRKEGSITSETQIDRHLAAAEPLLATCAIFEVVSALQSSKAVRELLPELFPVLLQQRTWILLENPKTHQEGVCLLVSLLLRSGLITPEIIQRLLPWVNSPTENHRVTSTAFLAQLMSDPMLREKKFLKPVLHILEERSHDKNSIVRQMAERGLGNLAYGAPEKLDDAFLEAFEKLHIGSPVGVNLSRISCFCSCLRPRSQEENPEKDKNGRMNQLRLPHVELIEELPDDSPPGAILANSLITVGNLRAQ
ncbi:unnamed protein product [Eretmochelys imbricata]